MLLQIESQYRIECAQCRPRAEILAPIRLRDQFARHRKSLRRIQIIVDSLMKAVVILRRPSRALDSLRRRLWRNVARKLPEIIEVTLRRTHRLVVENYFRAVLCAEAE